MKEFPDTPWLHLAPDCRRSTERKGLKGKQRNKSNAATAYWKLLFIFVSVLTTHISESVAKFDEIDELSRSYDKQYLGITFGTQGIQFISGYPN